MVDTSLQLRSKNQQYLDTWMDRISRSFAVVVQFLDQPLRDYLSTAYLICRVVDNIEDTTQAIQWKSDRFVEAARLLEQPYLAPEILASWEGLTWSGLTEYQQQIMGREHGLRLWEFYASLPWEPRKILEKWILEMIAGMRDLESPDHPPRFAMVNGVKLLHSYQDYEDYCYYVAGTVGHLATELVISHYDIPQKEAEALMARAESCGRGLQKTNILKDFSEDLSRGICYLPDSWLQTCDYFPLSLQGAPDWWNSQVMEDVLAELDDAARYLVSIPRSAIGYRQASLMCLLPAYQTLLLAAQSPQQLFTRQHNFKISRQTLAHCVEDSLRLASNDKGILDYSDGIQVAIRQAMAIPTGPAAS